MSKDDIEANAERCLAERLMYIYKAYENMDVSITPDMSDQCEMYITRLRDKLMSVIDDGVINIGTELVPKYMGIMDIVKHDKGWCFLVDDGKMYLVFDIIE